MASNLEPKINRIATAVTSALSALTAKGVTVPEGANVESLAALIEGIETGGGGGGGAVTLSAKWNDVTFIDYDGSVLYSYTVAEAQALTELPPLPEHEGLICQGWNWSLESIKALNREVTVGAMYITDDGSTRLNIRIATIGRMDVPLYINQNIANGVFIDWGDGSDAETLSGTGNKNVTHTYSEPGYYTISLIPKDGCALVLGHGSSNLCILGTNTDTGYAYCNMLQSVHIGKNVSWIRDYAFKNCYSLSSITMPARMTGSIGQYAFQSCYSLSSIAIPNSITSIRASAFQSCYSLSSIAIPNSVTSIENNTFYYCYSLNKLTVPNSVKSFSYLAQVCHSLSSITISDNTTSIGSYSFSNCYSLTSITIPASVISIGSYAFQKCYGMRYYDFSACTSVPTLSNTNAFNSIPSDCQMLIPAALFDEWSTATNWATYAKYMVSV